VPPVCALKPYIGHTLGACGVTELALMGSALSAGFFPATTGFEAADPALMISPRGAAGPAPDGFYLLNYFGFGGHNTALLLEKRA
jgi:3-oxoacyl-[acyl-carrier-protein] synthase-1